MSNNAKGLIFVFAFVLAILVPCSYGEEQQNNGLRTIEFETTEVTKAEVALSPDNAWLVFTMLGHLFRLPVEGGTAEQLTFGQSYNSEPSISPEGNHIAFISDRDGSEGNVFVLELPTGKISQITHELWASRPIWTPDGQNIIYLQISAFWTTGPHRFNTEALVRQVSKDGGEAKNITDQKRNIRSVFFLPDKRMACNVINENPWTTQIQVISPGGLMSNLCTVEGEGYLSFPSPAGDGLVLSIHHINRTMYDSWEELLFISLPDGNTNQVTFLERQVERRSWLNSGFALSADGKYLYVGDTGQLWKIALANGSRVPISFHASVKLEIQDPCQPQKWSPPVAGSSVQPRSIIDPRISADGSKLVFRSAGSFWLQSLAQSSSSLKIEPAERLFDDITNVRDFAVSPDSNYIVFLREDLRKDEPQEERMLFNLKTQMTSTLAVGNSYRGHSWSADGQRLVYVDQDAVVAFNIREGKKEKITDHKYRMSFVRLSPDERWLYYFSRPNLFRLDLKAEAKPEQLSRLSGRIYWGIVSPDCRWVAINRDGGIHLAELKGEVLRDDNFRLLGPEFGDSFSFAPDSSSLIYSFGNRVWSYSLESGVQEEIPVRLELQRPDPAPLLMKRVKILDFTEGGFGREVSLFIEQGRIRWIGSEQEHEIPPGTVAIDAKGRFAIPGLFDMHMHSHEWPQESFIAYGVTSVRDVGSRLPSICSKADQEESSTKPMPRYFYTGDIFNGAITGYLHIYNEDDARKFVHQRKELGAHYIKLYRDLPWRLQRAVAEETHKLDMPLALHIETVEAVIKSVRLGYSSIEHNRCMNRFHDDVFQMLALSRTRWTPTIGLVGGFFLLLHDEPERLSDDKLMTFTPAMRLQSLFRPRQGLLPWRVPEAALHGFNRVQLLGIKNANKRGVKLLVGSDAPAVPGLFFGWSLHWELEYFVQAGITPLEVLNIATQQAAEAVGAEDYLGTLEPGKLADIVLLEKNPLEDIKNTQSIWRVIKGGLVFDPEELKPEKLSNEIN